MTQPDLEQPGPLVQALIAHMRRRTPRPGPHPDLTKFLEAKSQMATELALFFQAWAGHEIEWIRIGQYGFGDEVIPDSFTLPRIIKHDPRDMTDITLDRKNPRDDVIVIGRQVIANKVGSPYVVYKPGLYYASANIIRLDRPYYETTVAFSFEEFLEEQVEHAHRAGETTILDDDLGAAI